MQEADIENVVSVDFKPLFKLRLEDHGFIDLT